MRYVLLFLMYYCFIQAVLGHQIKRIAACIAMYGEPERGSCYRPSKYVEGDWR